MVHYPLVARVGSKGFALCSEAHPRLTAYPIGPPALVEASSAPLLVFRRPEGVPLAASLMSFTLVAVVWLSTALLQVPRHTTLGSGLDQRVWGRLVLSNRMRTVAWSAGCARPS